MDSERLKYYVADKKVDPKYLEADFWLSGQYVEYETDTIKFRKLGEKVVEWAFAISRQKPQDLAQWMCTNTSIPKEQSEQDKIKHASLVLEYMLWMRGTVGDSSRDDSSNPRYLSPEARYQMEDYALSLPYLVDRIKVEAERDFKINGKILTPQEYRNTGGNIPINKFNYWREYFPRIFDEVFADAKTDDFGFVVDFSIQPVSQEYLKAVEPISDVY